MNLFTADARRSRVAISRRAGDAATPIRTLRTADALIAALLCIVSILMTRHVWTSAIFVAHPVQVGGCALLGLLGGAWLAWVRRFRWASCCVEHRWIGAIGFAVGLYFIRTGSLLTALPSVGALLMIVSTLVLVMGVQAVWRFAPALTTIALTIVLLNLQALIRTKYPMLATSPLLNTFARLAPGAILLAHLLAFMTPLYAGIRAAMLLVSPLAALCASALWPLVATPLRYFSNQSTAMELAASELLALLAVLATFLAALWLMRRAMIPVGPFALARSGR